MLIGARGITGKELTGSCCCALLPGLRGARQALAVFKCCCPQAPGEGGGSKRAFGTAFTPVGARQMLPGALGKGCPGFWCMRWADVCPAHRLPPAARRAQVCSARCGDVKQQRESEPPPQAFTASSRELQNSADYTTGRRDDAWHGVCAHREPAAPCSHTWVWLLVRGVDG